VRSIDEWAAQLESYVQSEGRVNDRNIHRGSATGTNTLDIGDTEAGKDYLRQLLNSNECGKLAELWVKGTKIDWKALHM